jgi:hypothetical protein
VEGDAIAQAGRHVAVEAVVRGVELAAREPLAEGRIRVVEDLLERLGPVQRARLLGPPGRRVARGLLVLGQIRDQGVTREVVRRVEPLDLQQVLELPLQLPVLDVGHGFSPPDRSRVQA